MNRPPGAARGLRDEPSSHFVPLSRETTPPHPTALKTYKRTLVTSALPYANGPLHIGHLAGAYLPSDLYTRFQRMRGTDIVHVCGSDEHGVPITIAAEREGVSPQEVVDRYHSLNKRTFERFGISFDHYSRTSSPVHHRTASDFFLKLLEKGVFKRKEEWQLYDAEKQMFLPDRYVKGTCPSCGHPEAYGDQCESCGTSLSPSELIDPVSALSGTPPEKRRTEHWYLPLGEFQEKIDTWIGSHPEWKPNVLGQCQSWIQAGLSDRAVTRDLNWGVPVPVDGADGKVLYVWFDAPIGYISATKEWAEAVGDPDRWKAYWQDEQTRLVHFIGKDNIVFHCIIFPAMLMAHGGFVLPEQVPANEFLNLEGRKLSTSRNWAIWVHEVIEEVDPDLLRYVLAGTMPETRDSDFSWKEFQQRVNTELADVLGNFLNRTLTFIARFREGSVPELTDPAPEDLAALRAIREQADRVAAAYESFRFKEAVHESLALARIGNRYFTETEPWKTRKSDPKRCDASLHVCAQLAGALSVLFDPLLPGRMRELRSALGLPAEASWDVLQGPLLPAGARLEAGSILFEKVEDAFVERMLAKLGTPAESGQADADAQADADGAADGGHAAGEPDPIREAASFEEFMKLDLRAARVLSADPVKGSSKLLRLELDLGLETRTVMSGIAKHVAPDDVVGHTVAIVANLAPRKIMGVESRGMVLMAEQPDGSLHLVETKAAPGSVIR